MNNTDFQFLIEHAVKAPSGHNTQPWKFENTKNGIRIHPDFSRRLSVVDAENRELYISLGCALENIQIAATRKGYHCMVKYPETNRECIDINFDKAETDNPAPDKLFNYISERQVTKCKYDKKPIPDEHIKMLRANNFSNTVDMQLFDGRKSFEQIIPFIIEANELQFNSREFINELVNWCRFSKKDARAKKDGIWSATMGMPQFGKKLGSLIMKNLMSAKSETNRLNKLMNHTAGILVFTTIQNNAEAWVKTGQAYQQFALVSTMLKIRHAHLNMPCEEPEISKKLAKQLNKPDEHPQLLVRYGYAKKMPYSHRRPKEEVITQNS